MCFLVHYTYTTRAYGSYHFRGIMSRDPHIHPPTFLKKMKNWGVCTYAIWKQWRIFVLACFNHFSCLCFYSANKTGDQFSSLLNCSKPLVSWEAAWKRASKINKFNDEVYSPFPKIPRGLPISFLRHSQTINDFSTHVTHTAGVLCISLWKWVMGKFTLLTQVCLDLLRVYMKLC